jgi:hypothetical protein
VPKTIFVDLLTLLFIYLKLTHQIDWNWALVVSPIVLALISGAILKRLFSWANKRKGLQEET